MIRTVEKHTDRFEATAMTSYYKSLEISYDFEAYQLYAEQELEALEELEIGDEDEEYPSTQIACPLYYRIQYRNEYFKTQNVYGDPSTVQDILNNNKNHNIEIWCFADNPLDDPEEEESFDPYWNYKEYYTE